MVYALLNPNRNIVGMPSMQLLSVAGKKSPREGCNPEKWEGSVRSRNACKSQEFLEFKGNVLGLSKSKAIPVGF